MLIRTNYDLFTHTDLWVIALSLSHHNDVFKLPILSRRNINLMCYYLRLPRSQLSETVRTLRDLVSDIPALLHLIFRTVDRAVNL